MGVGDSTIPWLIKTQQCFLPPPRAALFQTRALIIEPQQWKCSMQVLRSAAPPPLICWLNAHLAARQMEEEAEVSAAGQPAIPRSDINPAPPPPQVEGFTFPTIPVCVCASVHSLQACVCDKPSTPQPGDSLLIPYLADRRYPRVAEAHSEGAAPLRFSVISGSFYLISAALFLIVRMKWFYFFFSPLLGMDKTTLPLLPGLTPTPTHPPLSISWFSVQEMA